MAIVKLVNQARQMLEILDQQERGKAYDLAQLAQHVGVDSGAELENVAQALAGQGCVEIMEVDDGRGGKRVAIALKSMDFDPGLVIDHEEDDEKPAAAAAKKDESIIAETSVGLSGNFSVGSEGISVKVSPPRAVPAAPQASPPTATGGVGDLTIRQVLEALAGAIESSTEIEDREKYPLLDKIRSVAQNATIRKWLETPLNKMRG